VAYTPGTIIGLLGIAYLIWAVFEQEPTAKKTRAIRGGIYLTIGLVLFFAFHAPKM